MLFRFSHTCGKVSMFVTLLFLMMGCGSTVTVVARPVTTTATVPLATTTSEPGRCNAADFPTQVPGGPPTSSPEGPATGFHYPPLTYYLHITDAAGTYYYLVCSSGEPMSILTFMEHSLPAGGWTVTMATNTTITAVQTNVPQAGLCSSVTLTVGSHVGYPGEWDATFHSPTSACNPA